MKKTIQISFIIFVCLLLNSCDKTINIVDNQKSDYTIIIPKNSDTIIHKASKELQNYIHLITGKKLPITEYSKISLDNTKNIFVGFSENDTLQKHEILIKNDNQNLIISGGDSKSTLYAVYEFLEIYLNCRWYSPTVKHTPNSKKIELPLPINYRYLPPITTRTVHSRLFYNNTDFADVHKVTHESFPNYVKDARVHTFHKFIPNSFLKPYPEYFALRGDKRLHTQLCLSNPKVLEIVIDSVKAYFNRSPDSNIISVSQDDNTQYCQCDNCSAIDEAEGSHSGAMIRFVNNVAKEFPSKTISTLAYQYTRKPCKTKPAENVLITLCSIECDRSASIEENCTDFTKDLIGWGKLTSNIRIWDYTTQFTNFLAPFPNLHTLQSNVQLFEKNNANWVFEQHSNQPSELFELRSYMLAKLLWNPNLDTEELITDFVNGYYKKGGVYIKKYIDAIHKNIKKDDDFFLFLYGDPSQAFNSFLDSILLKEYDQYFNDAEKIVSNPKVVKRINEARLSIDYAILEACRKNLSSEFQLGKNTEKRLDRFKKTCEEGNITMMNEMKYSVEEYIINYKNTEIRASIPNISKYKKVTLKTNPKKYANENPQTLTDGSMGGANFYSNWLGFENNDMIAIIDLEEIKPIKYISTNFLQLTNHLVFFPKWVTYSLSEDNITYTEIGTIKPNIAISEDSKINDIEEFTLEVNPTKAQYIKIVAKNISKAPWWHNGAGLPAWIFIDEVIIN